MRETESKFKSVHLKIHSPQRLDRTIANETFAGSDDDMNDEVSGSSPTSSSPMTSQQPVELRGRHTSLTSHHNNSTTPKNVTARYHSHLFNSNNNDDLSSPAMASHSSSGRPTTTTTYLVSTSPTTFYGDSFKKPQKLNISPVYCMSCVSGIWKSLVWWFALELVASYANDPTCQ